MAGIALSLTARIVRRPVKGCVRLNVRSKFSTNPKKGFFAPPGWLINSRGYRLAKNLWFRRALRAFRISVLGATLYQLGRMSGIHDFVRDPNKHTSGFVVSALNSMDASAVEVCNGQHATSTQLIRLEDQRSSIMQRSEDMKRVRRVGERLIESAHEHVSKVMLFREMGIEECLGMDVKVKVNNIRKNGTITHVESDKKGTNTYTVKVEGNGERCKVRRKKFLTEEDVALKTSKAILEKKWIFLLYHSPNPNAFVTGLLPNHVFVASGLLHKDVCSNDDELAMVMGHELAHTILDHSRDDFNTAMVTTIASAVLVSILDPTGFGSFLYEMFGIGVLAKYGAVLPEKRCHENEADALGLTFAAKACFHPKEAVNFFNKLHQLETGTLGQPIKKTGEEDIVSRGGSVRGWTSDHPLTVERQQHMKESVGEAMKDYEEHCTSCKQNMTSMWRSISINNMFSK